MPKGVHNNYPKREQHWNWKGGTTISRNYVFIHQPDHPKANKIGYIKRAILVLEKKLGRPLLPGEVSHHIDGNKQNDDPDNLECMNRVDHIGHHTSKRPKIRETRVCVICGIDVIRCPSAFQVPPERTTCGFKCRNIFNGSARDEKGRFKRKEKKDAE